MEDEPEDIEDGLVRVCTFPDGMWVGRVVTEEAFNRSVVEKAEPGQFDWQELEEGTTILFVLVDGRFHTSRTRHGVDVTVAEILCSHQPDLEDYPAISVSAFHFDDSQRMDLQGAARYARAFLFGFLGLQPGPTNLDAEFYPSVLRQIDAPALCGQESVQPDNWADGLHGLAERNWRDFTDAMLELIDDGLGVFVAGDLETYDLKCCTWITLLEDYQVDMVRLEIEVLPDEEKVVFSLWVDQGNHDREILAEKEPTLWAAIRASGWWLDAASWPAWVEARTKPRPMDDLGSEAYILLGERIPALWSLYKFLEYVAAREKN